MASWKEPMYVNRGSVVISKLRCCGGALAETLNEEVAGRESHFRQRLMGLVKLWKVPNCWEWRVERDGGSQGHGRPCVLCEGIYLLLWQVGALRLSGR